MRISNYFNRKTLNIKQYGCNFQLLDSKILYCSNFFYHSETWGFSIVIQMSLFLTHNTQFILKKPHRTYNITSKNNIEIQFFKILLNVIICSMLMSAYTLRMVVIVLSMLSPLVLLKQNPATCTPPYKITIKQWERQNLQCLLH